MKVWITKYALTTGIFTTDVESTFSDGMVKATWPAYYHKGEWHKTEKEALERARDMAKRKLASLKNSAKKVEDMIARNFVVEEKKR